jgi:hypothetical protein
MSKMYLKRRHASREQKACCTPSKLLDQSCTLLDVRMRLFAFFLSTGAIPQARRLVTTSQSMPRDAATTARSSSGSQLQLRSSVAGTRTIKGCPGAQAAVMVLNVEDFLQSSEAVVEMELQQMGLEELEKLKKQLEWNTKSMQEL